MVGPLGKNENRDNGFIMQFELGRYRDNVLKKCLVDRNKIYSCHLTVSLSFRDQTFTELNIEKLQLVEAHKKKIQQEYVRKQRQIEVKKNI
ncbi:hypothetical protein L1987_21177 [Smallanthus sonchifolius]|uniref:Uncharacterized protein n=1 Tax=Smallanthus sonchifolius TaxID=185202 RepID=A0ACB9IUW3_9ASTR|nr:hypothetical protein L1987_21177 [Smallanthus sonchifolius]